MATIVAEGIAGELNGKLGGNVFYRNRYGMQVRKNFKPTDPRTKAQQKVRINFSNATSLWHQLDGAQKTAWQTFADTQFTSKFYQTPGFLSGHDVYNSMFISSRFAALNTQNEDSIGGSIGTTLQFEQDYDPPPGMIVPGLIDTSGTLFQLEIFGTVTLASNGFLSQVIFDVKALGSPPSPPSIDTLETYDNLGNRVPVGFVANISTGLVQDGLFVKDPFRYSTDFLNPINSLVPDVVVDPISLKFEMANNVSDYQAFPREGETVQITLFQISKTGMYRTVGSVIDVI